jgi:DNA-directed RNA polymerase specialized sigma24 family protein
MIDMPIERLPWLAIHAELSKLASEEARRWRVHRQEVEDAVQDTLRKILEIGAANLPVCLVGNVRGVWLRLVVRNAILRIRDSEVRWRRLQAPMAAAGRAAALQWTRHPQPGLTSVELSLLWPEEVEVVVLVHLGLSVKQIAEIDGLPPRDVMRRALWGGLRGQESPARVPAMLGRQAGSLAGLRGTERRDWIALMDRHQWPEAFIAEELGITLNALRLARAHGESHSEARCNER